MKNRSIWSDTKINKNYPEYPYLLPENVKYVLKENGFLIKAENDILSYGYKKEKVIDNSSLINLF